MNKINQEIIILDDLPPEANAMLQALYSRSPKSVKEHLKKVKESGPEKFMASFYVGYGHKSIGDCGTTSIFIENVSTLVAKAIQNWPLYSGQEASTRYLDMTKQQIVDPIGTKNSKMILDNWMNFYSELIEKLPDFLKIKFPKKDNSDEKIYEKAIKAKSFDIARGFLPAGITTFLSWHTNLRQAHDHLKYLRHHPLKEVREVAEKILKELKNKYQSSFLHEIWPTEEKYIEKVSSQMNYFNDKSIKQFKAVSKLDKEELKKFKILLSSRPEKTELPQEFRYFGNILFSFEIDFGSYRDLQRHRSAVQRMPLLTTQRGFCQWYLNQLPENMRTKAEKLIIDQNKNISKMKAKPEISQYYTALGYKVAVSMLMPLPSAIYVAELRSSKTVHPTLRIIAQKMALSIKKMLPVGSKIYFDSSHEDWDIKRGHQDIISKK